MLLPQKIDGLLGAGKAAILRGPQIRQRYSVELMGQAAGLAAALAVQQNVPPRGLDVKTLQQRLLKNGADLAPPERLRALGLR